MNLCDFLLRKLVSKFVGSQRKQHTNNRNRRQIDPKNYHNGYYKMIFIITKSLFQSNEGFYFYLFFFITRFSSYFICTAQKLIFPLKRVGA